MKNILYRSVILISLISFLITPVSALSEENPLIISLIAGQNEIAGNVKVWDDGDSLFVLYETTDSWCVTETHLAVASTLDGIHQKNGNPIPGQFTHKGTHKCVTSYLYEVPLDKNVCELYIAAHAVVESPGSTETAWGSGLDFPGNNWGTYYVYEADECSVTPTPTHPTPTHPTPTETITPTHPTPTHPTPTTTITPTHPTLTETITLTPPTPTETVALTPTPTVTATSTPPVCQPTVVSADFSQVATNASVEGMGVVAPGLNINAKGTAIKILPGTEPKIYISPNNDPTTLNAGVALNGGFTDAATKSAVQAHLYTFTFAPDVSVSNFSIQMLDFGDYNPTLNTNHYASIIAYDTQDLEVTRQELNYTTPPVRSPTSSNLYGNLQTSGDATGALSGQPGNWVWNVSGNGIVRIVLSFGDGFDPNIGFTLLSFTTTECP